jgi:RNA polymerase sigma factor (sigma-70 family)
LTEDGFVSFFPEQFRKTAFLLIRMGASRVDAEDATQEAMVQALRKWDRVSKPAAWVTTVAICEWRKLLRRRSQTVSLDESVQEPVPASDLSVLSEEQQYVLGLFRALPFMQRCVVALLYDGYTRGEIADMLNISEATVRSHLRHACNNLKRMMLSASQPGLATPSRSGVRDDRLRRSRVRSLGCLLPESACRGCPGLRVRC